MKNSVKGLMLAFLMMLGFCSQGTAQVQFQNARASLNEYAVQVRVNPKDKFAAHFRGPLVSVDRLSYHFTEFDSEQQAQDWAAANPDYVLLGVYPINPAPTKWQTVQVESNYQDAADAWYEIVINTEGLEVRIKTRTAQPTVGYSFGGNMAQWGSSNSSVSLTDQYYDFKVKVKLRRLTIGYLIETYNGSNSVILKTFQSQADYLSYMNAHPSYDLIESQNYWTRTTYTSQAFHVRTAKTLAEANDIMDFIEDENQYSSFRFSLGYIWNP